MNLKKLTMTDYSCNYNMSDIYMNQKYPRINIFVKELPYVIEATFEDIKKTYDSDDCYAVYVRYSQTDLIGLIKYDDVAEIYLHITGYNLNFPWTS